MKKDDLIVEVGAGAGSLTVLLAEKARRVIAFEVDERFVPLLKEVLKGSGRVEVVGEDIRQALAETASSLPDAWKLVGNIPYYLSSFIVRKALLLDNPPVSLVFLMQKALAERLAAQKRGRESPLSLLLKLMGEPRLGGVLRASCFWPRPGVDSRVIVVRRISRPTDLDPHLFLKFVRLGFRSPRKTLLNNLKRHFQKADLNQGRVEEILAKQLGIAISARPQQLSLEQWKLLYQALNIDQRADK